MCILIIKPKGAKMPPLATLKKCAISNPDGCGIATPKMIYRSLNFDTFADHALNVADDQPAIIHFRYATHGSIKKENCHPFKDRATGIRYAHNGVLPVEPIADMTDSETAFKQYFMPIIKRYGIYSQELKEVADKLIGSSKIAFLTPDGDLRVFGQFIEYNGCYYSNNTFRVSRFKF